MSSFTKVAGDGAKDPVERCVCVPTLGIKPGARLARAALRADGATLLSAGTELDVDQMRRLIQRGVEFVHVLEKETRDPAQIEQEVAAAVARVAYLFRGNGSAARGKLAALIADYRRQAVS